MGADVVPKRHPPLSHSHVRQPGKGLESEQISIDEPYHGYGRNGTLRRGMSWLRARDVREWRELHRLIDVLHYPPKTVTRDWTQDAIK